MNFAGNTTQRLINSMHRLGIRLLSVRDFIIKQMDKREERPPDKAMSIIFLLTWFLYVFGVIWVLWWLSYVTVDSAKWALSTQVQATAAIFGLLIAAVALVWRRITGQEQDLRERMYGHLKGLAQLVGRIPTVPVSNIAYDNYFEWITQLREKKERIGKDALINLGRLWVIKNFSEQYRSRLILGRLLTVGQTKQLSKVSKLSKESAIDMWEDYHRHPEDFIIKMHETLAMVSAVLTPKQVDSKSGMGRDDEEAIISETSKRLNNIAGAIVYNDDKVMAEEVKRIRLALRPRFYFTSLVLAFAIVLGLCILTGIEGTLFPPILSGLDNLMWAVGIPVALSIFGIALCLGLIRRII